MTPNIINTSDSDFWTCTQCKDECLDCWVVCPTCFARGLDSFKPADKDDSAAILAYMAAGKPIPAGTYHLPDTLWLPSTDKKDE